MAEKPIIFRGPMVRAILDGRKTMTRRVLKDVPPQPEANCRHEQKHTAPYLDSYCNAKRTPKNLRRMSNDWCWWQVDDRQCLPTFKVPYVPGDLLYVRETWGAGTRPDPFEGCVDGLEYRADQYFIDDDEDLPLYPVPDHDLCEYIGEGWRPSIHMPKWAARIWLEVTDVKAERLQDISEEDAIAEGIERMRSGRGYYSAIYGKGAVHAGHWFTEARGAFEELWRDIHGPASWDANPWVCAISFRRIEQKQEAA